MSPLAGANGNFRFGYLCGIRTPMPVPESPLYVATGVGDITSHGLG